jgi:hypothetical protein
MGPPDGPETVMATDIRLKESLPGLTDRIVETYEECGPINHLGHSPLPSYREVVEILTDLREILFPATGGGRTSTWGTSSITSAT